jgi:hypothetical protein
MVGNDENFWHALGMYDLVRGIPAIVRAKFEGFLVDVAPKLAQVRGCLLKRLRAQPITEFLQDYGKVTDSTSHLE